MISVQYPLYCKLANYSTSVAIAAVITGLIIGSISQSVRESVSAGLHLFHYPLIVFRYTLIRIC
jgi:hypothetical protein